MHDENEIATEPEEYTEDQLLSTPCVPTIEKRGTKYRVKHYSSGKNRISYTQTITEAEELVEKHRLLVEKHR